MLFNVLEMFLFSLLLRVRVLQQTGQIAFNGYRKSFKNLGGFHTKNRLVRKNSPVTSLVLRRRTETELKFFFIQLGILFYFYLIIHILGILEWTANHI